MNPDISKRTLTAAEVRAKHKEFLFPSVANFYAESLVPAEAKGLRVRDLDGREYLDFFGGILTVGVGHANDAVNAAVTAQMSRFGHVSSLYPTVPVVELAEKLASITPGALKKCFFTASGTEADETAVVLAQVHTQQTEVIALRHGYSGRSILAQSLTAHAPWRAVPTQVAAVKHVAAPYCYRCPFKLKYPSCGVACAHDLDELIRTTTNGKPAAFLAEPIMGVGGFVTPPEEYFQIAVEIVRRYGGVFICDEVQSGMGRTGKWWAIEHYGVEPDLLTAAKSLANGMPLSVCIATPAIADAFTKSTISTFGGNPVSCAASLATIGEIESRGLLRNATEMGARLREGLERLQKRHPRTIGDVRGKGLMQGIELVKDETAGDRTPNGPAANALMEETKKRGLLIGKGGHWGTGMRISPALTVTASEIDEALKKLGEALEAMGA